jgi:putative transcriptional regulator
MACQLYLSPSSKEELPTMENRLRTLRNERRWSQLQLAERLEVSRQSVNAIETGKYDPSLPLAFRVAELFERSIEEIFVSPSRRSSKAI